MALLGSSPHTRDKLLVEGFTVIIPGIIPAYAGQINTVRGSDIVKQDHPRIRGTNLHGQPQQWERGGSSPHTRDKLKSF